VLLAADAFGGAACCVDMAAAYALEREQFGTVIGRFQGLKHQRANMAVDVEPARGLYWYAAHAFDAVPADAQRMAALAKAHLGDRYLQAARDATEAHGGIGYTWEYPLHVWLKRAVFDRVYLGAPAEHRRRSAALAGWVSG
jgi:alkylation response protein AidB-like acyl-CoA dehydrogenase